VGKTATTSQRARTIISLSDPGQREVVDDDATGGRFLLTDSAGVSPGGRIYSGVGRIGSLHRRPPAEANPGSSSRNCRWLSGDTIGYARVASSDEIDLAPCRTSTPRLPA
jgi:hypothetical protein